MSAKPIARALTIAKRHADEKMHMLLLLAVAASSLLMSYLKNRKTQLVAKVFTKSDRKH